MEQNDLIKLLQQPESEKLEFRKRLPDFREIVSNLVAFANTNGGKLIIGVDDRGKIVGINNSERARRIISKAADAISPPLKVHIQPIEVEGKKVLVVDIPKGDISPYFAYGRAWQRVGAANLSLTSENLFSNIIHRSRSNEDLKADIKRLSNVVEKMNKDLISARSWKVKITDMTIGGVIGAIISLLITLMLGAF